MQRARGRRAWDPEMRCRLVNKTLDMNSGNGSIRCRYLGCGHKTRGIGVQGVRFKVCGHGIGHEMRPGGGGIWRHGGMGRWSLKCGGILVRYGSMSF